MGITKRERFLRAHFKLLRKYIFAKRFPCPLCRIPTSYFVGDCGFCTQSYFGCKCIHMKTYQHWKEGSTIFTVTNKLRAKYHIEAIKILREIPKERFTKKGHVGFPELFELDDRLYQEYLRSKK